MTIKELKELLNSYPDSMEVEIYQFQTEDTQGGWWEKHPLEKGNIENDKNILIFGG